MLSHAELVSALCAGDPSALHLDLDDMAVQVEAQDRHPIEWAIEDLQGRRRRYDGRYASELARLYWYLRRGDLDRRALLGLEHIAHDRETYLAVANRILRSAGLLQPDTLDQIIGNPWVTGIANLEHFDAKSALGALKAADYKLLRVELARAGSGRAPTLRDLAALRELIVLLVVSDRTISLRSAVETVLAMARLSGADKVPAWPTLALHETTHRRLLGAPEGAALIRSALEATAAVSDPQVLELISAGVDATLDELAAISVRL